MYRAFESTDDDCNIKIQTQIGSFGKGRGDTVCDICWSQVTSWTEYPGMYKIE